MTDYLNLYLAVAKLSPWYQGTQANIDAWKQMRRKEICPQPPPLGSHLDERFGSEVLRPGCSSAITTPNNKPKPLKTKSLQPIEYNGVCKC